MRAVLDAAPYGKAGTLILLLVAGADIEARDIVSKRTSICLAHVCVCVCYILPSKCMISEKCRFVVFLYFIVVICRI